MFDGLYSTLETAQLFCELQRTESRGLKGHFNFKTSWKFMTVDLSQTSVCKLLLAHNHS